jgi:polyisoprenoid-binding protein YceI
VKSGQKLAEGEYKIQGDMEIKGISQPVEFVAKIDKEDRVLKGKANLKLDRTKWDIKYNSGKFFKNLGDKLIYDDFEIEVEVVAEKA